MPQKKKSRKMAPLCRPPLQPRQLYYAPLVVLSSARKFGSLLFVFVDPEPLLRAKETSHETPSQSDSVFGCPSLCGLGCLPGALPPKRRAILSDLREYQFALLARSRSWLARRRNRNGCQRGNGWPRHVLTEGGVGCLPKSSSPASRRHSRLRDEPADSQASD